MTRPRLVCAIFAPMVFLACGQEPVLDTTRQIPERGTLGEEIFRLFHRDLEREAPRRAEGFLLRRDQFVGAVDHLFPPDELADTQAFMVRLLPRYDDGTIPSFTRRTAAVLKRLEEDQVALRAYTALKNRKGYVAPQHAHALALRLARFEHYLSLTDKLLALALAHDGLDDDGETSQESDALTRLMATLTKSMRELELSTDDERDIILLANLLLKEDQRLATQVDGPGIVARDTRGMAQVKSFNGAVPLPFVDVAPADGMPDVDADGRFVTASGEAIENAPYGDEGERDGLKRAMNRGSLVYDHVNLDQTILAGVLRDTKTLIEQDIPDKGIRSLKNFLGERGADGLYSAHNNALVDLAYASGVALDFEQLPEMLEVAETLFDAHEGTLAFLLNQTEQQLDIADRYDVSLSQGSTFFDDLMSVVRKILREPGFAEDLLITLEDPRILQLPLSEARLSKTNNRRITEQEFDNNQVLRGDVDRSRPDVNGNYSLHQRVLHLLFDTKGARYEPSFIGIPIGFVFEIDDLAEFYMLSLIGESTVPGLVSTLTGLPTTPTPEDLARFLNTEQTFGNPQGHEGIDVMENDGDTLFAVSASGMKTGLIPLVEVFHRHGKLDLLFDLFEVLHLHWASAEGDYQNQSRSTPKYSKRSGIRYYEPLLIDVYENTNVVQGVQKLLIDTKQLRTRSGAKYSDVILGFARKFINKDQDLETRTGERQVVVDGDRITPLSPFDLIRGAMDSVKKTTRRRASTQQDWNDISDALHDRFIATEPAGNLAGRFTNSRTQPVMVAAIAFMRERAEKHRRAGNLSTFVQEDIQQAVEDLITSEELPAIIDVLDAIDADEELSGLITLLRDELLNDGFADLLVVAGDQVASAKDAQIAVPFINFFGREFDPEKKLLFDAASSTRKMIETDGHDKVLEVARRGLEEDLNGELFINGIFDAIEQTNRVNPLAHGLLETEDSRLITNTTHSYLSDGEHGFEKFFDLVEKRK